MSATVGKAALRVTVEYGVEVHATELSAAEVEEYIPAMCEKFAIPEHLVRLQWRLLPVFVHPVTDYVRHLRWARAELATRDPDDAHPLALARALGLTLWSNDHDLEGRGVECLTTARLLRALADRG